MLAPATTFAWSMASLTARIDAGEPSAGTRIFMALTAVDRAFSFWPRWAASCNVWLSKFENISRAEREPLRVLTGGCHYFTIRPWPDGGARGDHEPPGATLDFCRLGLRTT